jgi:hypothetical protein
MWFGVIQPNFYASAWYNKTPLLLPYSSETGPVRKLTVVIFGTIILTTISLTAIAKAEPRALPEIIQNLSDKEYAVWAQWQNRQAVRRAGEIADKIRWEKYDYIDRMVSRSFSRGDAMTRTSVTSRSSGRAASRHATRNGYVSTNLNRSNGTTIAFFKDRCLNPDYVGPSAIVAYNPWVRSENRTGKPDWANLFVPCEEGTITMQEVLDRLIGPQKPERVYKIMLEGFIGD